MDKIVKEKNCIPLKKMFSYIWRFLLSKLFNLLNAATFMLWCSRTCLIPKTYNIFVFDLDNTICDTWPTLQKNSSHVYPQIFLNFKNGIYQLINSKKTVVLVLSARKYRVYFKTLRWITQNIQNMHFFNIFLVPSPLVKIKFLKRLQRHKNVWFYDDMSFNHENDNVLHYLDCITQLKELNINYRDYSTILKIQNDEIKLNETYNL